MFEEILLRRKNKIIIPAKVDENEPDEIVTVLAMLKNIQSLGYTFSKELIKELRYVHINSLKATYSMLVRNIKYYVGADKVYNFMFPNFPEQVLEESDFNLYSNVVKHYMSYGTWLPDFEKDERLPLFENDDFTVLEIGTLEDCTDIMYNLIGSKTSLSQQDQDDLCSLLVFFGVDKDKLPQIPFKENIPIVSNFIMLNSQSNMWFHLLKGYYKTATDVLRFAVYLSEGDVSLATPTMFKSMPRKVRKLLIQLLNNCSNIEEDMLRHKTAWIRLGERLHVCEEKYSKYANAQRAFDKVRNDGKIITFAGKLYAALKDKLLPNAISLLKKRPGVFARELDSLLRKHKDRESTIIKSFKDVAQDVSVPVLLQVKEHFAWRSKKNDTRVFFPKGTLAKAYTKKNELEDIPQIICDAVTNVCEKAIIEQFEEKEPLGKVYIADCMNNYCIPQSQRSANSAMKIITRGSRFKLKDDAKFIRLGIHWMNEALKNYGEKRTDIDLSCSFLDENFGKVSHVSYTNLRNGYAVHSGDLTNAPRWSGGSAECLDLYIDKAIESGVKYAAIQVYGYTETKFNKLDDMLFNWQEGIDENVGDIFEPARVQQCMNLGGDTDCEIPIVIDLVNKEIIWLDLALTTRTDFPRCVEGNVSGLSAVVMGIVQAHKPTMYSLARLNAIARGRIVYDRNEADVIFDTDLTKPTEVITKYIEVQNEKGEIISTRTETEERVKDCIIITPWDVDIWQGEML